MRTNVVYLIHFERSFRHCRHYLGSAVDLDARLRHHRAGTGSRLLRAVVAAGIKFEVVRTWDGGRQLERKLKNRKNAPRLCPICSRREK
jgi:predicted GIY-YIG superfamily endonuclease